MKTSLVSGFNRFIALALLISSQLSWADADSEIIVSIKPIHSIVAGLTKDITDPVLLIDGAQTPFDFELNQQQVEQLSHAKLIFWVGPELEQSLQPTLAQLPETVTVVELLSSPRLKILPSRKHPDLRDPFFWMDDRNVMIMLDEITELLIELDPGRSHIYERNRREMLKPLRRIDKEYEYGYRGMKAGVGVQYFDTLQYFEQAYALTLTGHVTGSPRDSEDAISLLKVRSRINNNETSCLFLDKGLPAANLAALTDGLNLNLGELDTLGLQFEAGPKLYLQLMEYNTDVIKACLNADMNEAEKARAAAYIDDKTLTDGIGNGRFILTNHVGQDFTELDMRGQYSLVFFGYTFCPDICPTELATITQTLKILGGQAKLIQPYFITIDPARDTIAVMNGYVSYFDPRLIGLTGSIQMIKRVADQFKAKFERGKNLAGDPALYTMDHTTSLYLMAPDGTFVTKFAYGITADVLAEELKSIIAGNQRFPSLR